MSLSIDSTNSAIIYTCPNSEISRTCAQINHANCCCTDHFSGQRGVMAEAAENAAKNEQTQKGTLTSFQYHTRKQEMVWFANTAHHHQVEHETLNLRVVGSSPTLGANVVKFPPLPAKQPLSDSFTWARGRHSYLNNISWNK